MRCGWPTRAVVGTERARARGCGAELAAWSTPTRERPRALPSALQCAVAEWVLLEAHGALADGPLGRTAAPDRLAAAGGEAAQPLPRRRQQERVPREPLRAAADGGRACRELAAAGHRLTAKGADTREAEPGKGGVVGAEQRLGA